MFGFGVEAGKARENRKLGEQSKKTHFIFTNRRMTFIMQLEPCFLSVMGQCPITVLSTHHHCSSAAAPLEGGCVNISITNPSFQKVKTCLSARK